MQFQVSNSFTDIFFLAFAFSYTFSYILHLGDGGIGQNSYNNSLADVYIYVTDKNDNAPIFSKKVFYYDFKQVMAKQLINITARDPDLGEGGKVKYRLLSFKRVSWKCITMLN